MNKFEKKAIEVELLKEVYNDLQRRKHWYCDVDEDGTCTPLGEEEAYRVSIIEEIMTYLEKRL